VGFYIGLVEFLRSGARRKMGELVRRFGRVITDPRAFAAREIHAHIVLSYRLATGNWPQAGSSLLGFN